MKLRVISLGIISVLLSTLVFAIPPVTLSGPTPALHTSYSAETDNTIIYTVNNFSPQAIPLAIGGISSPLTLITVPNNCSCWLAAGTPQTPSTCQIGFKISPTTAQVGSSINQTLSVNYLGRAPLTSPIDFLVTEPIPAYVLCPYPTGIIFMLSSNSYTGQLILNSTQTYAGMSSTAIAVATNSSGSYVYVTNSGDGGGDDMPLIYMYSIDPFTGLLSPLENSPIFVDNGPYSIVINSAGTFAYVVNHGRGTVSVYSIGQSIETGGQLMAVPDGTVASGQFAAAMAINPTGSFAYVVNQISDTVSMYSIDQSTGKLTPLNPATVGTGTGSEPTSITINPAGTFAYVANQFVHTVSMFSIDQSTGQLTPLNPATVDTGSYPVSIAISLAGTFAYVVNNVDSSVSMYSIHQTTGQLTPLNPPVVGTGTDSNPTSITISQAGYAYVTNSGSNDVSMYSINQITGQLTPLSPATVGTEYGPISMAIAG